MLFSGALDAAKCRFAMVTVLSRGGLEIGARYDDGDGWVGDAG